MKNKKVGLKNTGGFNLALIGLVLIGLPFALASADVALDISEGANIGVGVLGLFTVPVGFALVLIGLLRILSRNLKK